MPKEPDIEARRDICAEQACCMTVHRSAQHVLQIVQPMEIAG